MLSLFGISLPSWSTVVSSSSDYSDGFFNEFSPLIYLSVGIIVGVILLLFIGHGILKALGILTNN